MNCNCPQDIAIGPILASTCSGASFVIFMSILEAFLRSQCDLEDPCNRPQSSEWLNTHYDFVVIGGGSGGATVAGRLAEGNDFSVLLIEAGFNAPTVTQVPSLFRNFINSDIDWKYKTEPETHACLNRDGICSWPRGKALGGMSVINDMMYMRGSRKDYDDWASLGNNGWSYDEVLPYFFRSENNLQIRDMDYGFHAIGGPLTVQQFPYHPQLSYAFIEAGKELGYENVDLNGKSHTGFAITQATTKNGARVTTARAFLHPLKNNYNLHVTLNSTATRIIFDDNKRAIAVEFIRDNTLNRVNVVKEVIVSGGAINSPQILLNSGIGPAEDLNTMGIPIVHNLTGVGENLHSHVSYSLEFTVNSTDENLLNWVSSTEYLLYRNGFMSGTGISALTAMINTKYANITDDHPDIQLIFDGYLANCASTGAINETQGDKRRIQIIPTLLHPKSRGYLTLRDSNLLSYPKIYPNYFTEPEDIARLVDGIKFAISLAQTEALSKYNLQLDTTPVEGCEDLEFASDSYWECAVKRDTSPENHQAGSCKMGTDDDPLAVVDNKLRVRGVEGVRIADTSIMPKVTSGNTNAVAIMIGERAAEFIKTSCLLKYDDEEYYSNYV